MPRELAPEPSPSAEEHLWQHGLYLEDAYEVIDEGQYKVFDDGGHPGNLKVIGPDAGNRLLTIVLKKPVGNRPPYIISGWPSDNEEAGLYSRPGGTQHV